jgi:hypothetical protein
MRNGGLPPAHLLSSTATPLDPLRWLVPPQRAPEPQPPVHASDAATSALAHYDEIISQRMISLYKQALAKCAELAAQAQRVETARSVALATWQHQEDAAHEQALAEEADIQRHRDDTFRAITDGFTINPNILAVEMASWHGADDAMALLAMKHRKDDANAQGYLDGHAARALQNAAARMNVLAASRCQEDNVHAKAIVYEADKRTCRETTLRATQLQYVAQLGFTFSSKFFALVAECDASWDGAVAEAPNRTPVLAEKALAEEQRCHKTAMQEKAWADEAKERRQAAAWEKALADEAHEQRETAEHATTLVVTMLTKLKAAPKVRYGGPPPTHFSLPLTATGVAKLDAAILDKRRRHETAVREKAFAEDKRRQEETAKKQRRADHEHIMAPVLPPDPGNEAIQRIWVECALLAAPLDAILAEIEHDNIAHEA